MSSPFEGQPSPFKSVGQKANTDAHRNADTDVDRSAIHHTLGSRPNQAAPGNHKHFTSGTSVLDAGADISPLPNDGVFHDVFTFPPFAVPKKEYGYSTTARIFAFFSARALANSASHWKLICINTGAEIDYHLGHNYADQYLNVGAALSGTVDLSNITSLELKIIGNADVAGVGVSSIGPAHINVSFD